MQPLRRPPEMQRLRQGHEIAQLPKIDHGYRNDAFYEWTAPLKGAGDARKQPWCFHTPDDGLLLLAGLWEEWRPKPAGKGGDGDDPAGDTDDAATTEPLRTCTILTTGANEFMRRFHDRMPVVIRPDDLEGWLAPEPLEPGELEALTQPAPDALLDAYAVSTRLNNSRAEGSDLADPIPVEGQLFD